MPVQSGTRPATSTADKMIEYDELEARIIALGTDGQDTSELLDQQEEMLEALFNSAAFEATDTSIIQKDANVFRTLVNARNSQRNPVTSTFLRVLDAQELEDAFKRLTGLHGLDKVLESAVVDFPNRGTLPASVPRGFGEAVVRQLGPREKKTREEGPARHTVAFDQERQQSDEARAIKAIKLHLKTRYLLEQRMPISYYQFVLKHESFVQTVENVFYLSFLIRDNYVQVLRGDSLLETKIRPLFRRPSDEDQEDQEEDQEEDSFVVEGCDESDYVQKTSGSRLLFLAEMKHSLWKELCETFPDGGIPLRRSSDECQYTSGRQRLPLLSPPLTN